MFDDGRSKTIDIRTNRQRLQSEIRSGPLVAVSRSRPAGRRGAARIQARENLQNRLKRRPRQCLSALDRPKAASCCQIDARRSPGSGMSPDGVVRTQKRVDAFSRVEGDVPRHSRASLDSTRVSRALPPSHPRNASNHAQCTADFRFDPCAAGRSFERGRTFRTLAGGSLTPDAVPLYGSETDVTKNRGASDDCMPPNAAGASPACQRSVSGRNGISEAVEDREDEKFSIVPSHDRTLGTRRVCTTSTGWSDRFIASRKRCSTFFTTISSKRPRTHPGAGPSAFAGVGNPKPEKKTRNGERTKLRTRQQKPSSCTQNRRRRSEVASSGPSTTRLSVA